MVKLLENVPEKARQRLRQGDIDPNSLDGDGKTLLWRVAFNGHTAVVQLLLEREGVEADPKDEEGRTAMWWAAAKGYKVIAQLLPKQAAADLNSKSDGLTTLIVAAEYGHEEMVQLLLDQTTSTPT